MRLSGVSLCPASVENYFNYFTEIEDHFQRRRGTLILLSPLDWALMEIWKDAGIPLEAVLRGIDAAFDKWERRPRRTRKVNGLAYCAQEVLATAEEMKEAAVGADSPRKQAPGLEASTVADFLRHNAAELERAPLSAAVRAIADKVKAGQLEPAEITERVLSDHLYTRHWPDPDLLIRTSGEMRISNFLLWQISYAEFVVTPTLWPDFRKPQLCEAIEEYARRHRRFGGV